MAPFFKKSRVLSLLCLLLLCAFRAQAQMPVTVAPQLVPPYSLRISDYYQGSTPRLFVTLINNDFDRPGLRVRLRMTIKGRATGTVLQTLPSASIQPVTLNGGVPLQLSFSDLQPYFNPDNLLFSGLSRSAYQQLGALPEDLYEFCFEAYEAVTGEKLSNGGCATAYITLSDPPLLNTPLKATSVKITEPANITFNWTPRHRTTAANPSEYTFQIIEIYNTGSLQPGTATAVNPQSAFNQQKVLFEEKTTNSSFVYGPTAPLLIPGKLYAWRVQASLGGQDQSIFRNGGYSEVSYFTAIPYCPAVSNVVAYSVPGALNLNWMPATGASNYTVTYRKAGGNYPWQEMSTGGANTLQIPNLEAGGLYEYQIGFGCGTANVPVLSPVQTIKIAEPVRIKGKVEFALPAAAEQNTLTGAPYAYVTSVAQPRRTTLAPDATGAGSQSYPLKGGTVKLQFLSGSRVLDSLRLTTDASGNYTTEVPQSIYAALGGNLTGLSVKATSEIINHAPPVNTTIPVATGSTATNSANLKLVLNTMEAQISTYSSASLSPAQQSGVVMDVFAPKAATQNVPFWSQLFSGNREEIVYNGEAYTKVESRNEAKPVRSLPKLPAGRYLVRVTFGTSVNYYTLDDTYNNTPGMMAVQKAPGNRLVIFENYALGSGRQLTGTVAYNGSPRKDIRVLLQGLRGGTVVATAPATTATDGRYTVPFPVAGTEAGLSWTVQVRDGSNKLNNQNAPEVLLQNIPFTGSKEQNFDFDFRTVSLTGRVVDQIGVPMAGARVAASAGTTSYGTVLTNTAGFYSLSVPRKVGSLRLQIEADNSIANTAQITISPSGTTVLTPAAWEAKVKALPSVQSAFGNSAGSLTPQAVGFAGGTGWADVHEAIVGEDNPLMAALDGGTTTLTKTKSEARFQLVFARGSGKAKIVFPNNLGERSGSHNEVITMLLPYGQQDLTIAPLPNESPLNPFTVPLSYAARDTGIRIINVADFVRLTGTVTSNSNAPIKEAKLVLEGVNVPVYTDAAGKYALNLPRNQSYTLNLTKLDFKSVTRTIQANADAVLDLTMISQPEIPAVNKLGGFEVTVTKIERTAGSETVYRMSGNMVLPASGAFAPASAADKLTFENIEVQVDKPTQNAYPAGDVRFKETVLNVKAFGYAPVEMQEASGILLKALPGTNGQPDTKTGGIAAGKLLLKLEGNQNLQKLTLNLKNATLKNAAAGSSTGPEIVFAPAGSTAGPQSSTSYKTTFEGTTTADGFIASTLNLLVPVAIDQKESLLSNDGLSLKGYVGIPNIPGLKVTQNGGRVFFKNFTLGKSFEVKSLTLDVAATKPLEIGLQRVRGKIDEVSLYNIGTSNAGLGFAGSVFVKKPVAGGAADTVFIKKFDFLRQGGQPSVAGTFRLGAKGIGIKGLSYNMSSSDELAMSYNAAERNFKFAASGTLNYQSNSTSSEGKFSGSLFPIVINRFEFGTKNWSFFLVASPNAEVKIKVATIRLEKLLVSIGNTGLSRQSLLNNLVSDQVGGSAASITGDEEAMVDEAAASWGVGFKGGLAFESALKGLKVDAAATMLVSNINNSIAVDVNELALKIDQAAFTLAVQVKLLLQGPKVGFEGNGELAILKRGFQAGFKYYKLTEGNNSGIEMGASFALTTPVVTGPIQWFKIGGGFEFNTLAQTFSVFANGDLGAPGTPKESMYLKDNIVKLSFNLAQCSGWPVFELSGKLNVATKDWLAVAMKVDFCQSLMLITMNGSIPIIPAADVRVSGVLFTSIDNPGTSYATSQTFFGLAASVNILNGLLQGNAFIGMGINYSNVHPKSPQEAKNMWYLIDPEVKERNNTYFNGINVTGSRSINSSGGVNIGGGGISLISASYFITVNQQVKFYMRFTDKAFYGKFSGNLDAGLSASFLGIGLSGRASANYGIGGGYNNGWRIAGNVSVRLEVYNNANQGCNTWTIGWNSNGGICGTVGWPCGCLWCDWCTKRVCTGCPTNNFKFCLNSGISFSYVQGQPLQIKL